MTTSVLSGPDCLREYSHLETQRFQELSSPQSGEQDMQMRQHFFRNTFRGKAFRLSFMPLGRDGILL